MSSTVEGSQKCSHTHSIDQNSCYKDFMCVLEKISLVALAVFAGYTNPKLFLSFFGGGVFLGIVTHITKKHECGDKHGHEDGGGCSQGFLEQLTGVRLPAPVGLAANVAITVCHIDHHQTIFIPLIGLNAGMWVGKLIAQAGQFAYSSCSQNCYA